jgi:hypothetical protein
VGDRLDDGAESAEDVDGFRPHVALGMELTHQLVAYRSSTARTTLGHVDPIDVDDLASMARWMASVSA